MSRSAEDFDAIEQAVRESARGRWFLEEHAKRIRRQDTAELLQAMDRLESAVMAAHDRLEERLCLALGLGPPVPAANTNQPQQAGAQDRPPSRIVLIRRGVDERLEVPLQEEVAGAS